MIFEIFFILLIVHFICDYPLQGEFLSRAKNHLNPIEGVPFIWALVAHSGIHAGGVWLVTGEWWAGLLEFVAHCMIDYLKCDKCFGFSIDQSLHIFVKAIIVFLIFAV